MEYLNRIAPDWSVEQAEALATSIERDMVRLRPKARTSAQAKLDMITRDIAELRTARGV